MSVLITRGFPQAQRADAARLYWAAFGGKLGRIMGPEARALAYIERVMRPDHALAAVADGGRLIGVAGFKSPLGAFVDGAAADMREAYGMLGGTLRAALVSVLPRDADNDNFLVDGLCVRPDARGNGVGGALIEALCAEARSRGYGQVRLDVVSENLRARDLYQRHGFEVARQSRHWVNGWAYGYSGSVTMVRRL